MLKNLFALYAVLLICFITPSALEALQSSISRGSSLSVEDDSHIFLVSPSKSFAFGFYEVGTNAFVVSIWFSKSANKNIVWTANRDRPVNGHGSRVTFGGDGSIALMDVDGIVVWSTSTNSTQADVAQLLDTGKETTSDNDTGDANEDWDGTFENDDLLDYD